MVKHYEGNVGELKELKQDFPLSWIIYTDRCKLQTGEFPE